MGQQPRRAGRERGKQVKRGAVGDGAGSAAQAGQAALTDGKPEQQGSGDGKKPTERKRLSSRSGRTRSFGGRNGLKCWVGVRWQDTGGRRGNVTGTAKGRGKRRPYVLHPNLCTLPLREGHCLQWGGFHAHHRHNMTGERQKQRQQRDTR